MGPTRLTARNRETGLPLADWVRIADSHLRRAVGLLGRSGLRPGEALWIVPSRGVHTWGMRFPIDVVALDDTGAVVDLVPAMPPWRVRLPRAGTAGVLELRAGSLEESGTRIGHHLVFEVVAGQDGHEASPQTGERRIDSRERRRSGAGAARVQPPAPALRGAR